MLIRWRTLPRIRFLGPSPPDASFTSHSPPPSSLLWARRRNQDVWGNEKDTVASVSKGRQAIISEETHLLRSGGFLLDLRVEGGHSLRALTHQVEANPQGRCGLTPQTSQTLNSRSGSVSVLSWCAQGFVWAFWASLATMEFNCKCSFAPSSIVVGLLLYPWTWDIFLCVWNPTFHVDGCSAASYNFGALAGEDKHMSYYSAIMTSS